MLEEKNRGSMVVVVGMRSSFYESLAVLVQRALRGCYFETRTS